MKKGFKVAYKLNDKKVVSYMTQRELERLEELLGRQAILHAEPTILI